MKRVLSQYVCVNSHDIRTRTVIEFSDDDIVLAIFSIDEGNVEPANTLFFDGVISGELIDGNFNVVPDSEIFTFISKHAKPIMIGEKNQLIIWKNIDFSNKRMGEKCRIAVLKTIV